MNIFSFFSKAEKSPYHDKAEKTVELLKRTNVKSPGLTQALNEEGDAGKRVYQLNQKIQSAAQGSLEQLKGEIELASALKLFDSSSEKVKQEGEKGFEKLKSEDQAIIQAIPVAKALSLSLQPIHDRILELNEKDLFEILDTVPFDSEFKATIAARLVQLKPKTFQIKNPQEWLPIILEKGDTEFLENFLYLYMTNTKHLNLSESALKLAAKHPKLVSERLSYFCIPKDKQKPLAIKLGGHAFKNHLNFSLSSEDWSEIAPIALLKNSSCFSQVLKVLKVKPETREELEWIKLYLVLCDQPDTVYFNHKNPQFHKELGEELAKKNPKALLNNWSDFKNAISAETWLEAYSQVPEMVYKSEYIPPWQTALKQFPPGYFGYIEKEVKDPHFQVMRLIAPIFLMSQIYLKPDFKNHFKDPLFYGLVKALFMIENPHSQEQVLMTLLKVIDNGEWETYKKFQLPKELLKEAVQRFEELIALKDEEKLQQFLGKQIGAAHSHLIGLCLFKIGLTEWLKPLREDRARFRDYRQYNALIEVLSFLAARQPESKSNPHILKTALQSHESLLMVSDLIHLSTITTIDRPLSLDELIQLIQGIFKREMGDIPDFESRFAKTLGKLRKYFTILTYYRRMGYEVRNSIRQSVHEILQGTFKENRYSSDIPMEWRTALPDQTFEINGKTYTLCDSDDPIDLYLCGEEVDQSCLNMKSKVEYLSALINIVIDKKYRLILLRNDQGEIVSRSLIRLGEDTVTKEWVIYFEKEYSKGSQKNARTLLNLAFDKSRQMKCPLVTSSDFLLRSKIRYPNAVSFKIGPNEYEYVDALGCIVEKDYKIEHPYLVQEEDIK